MPANPIHVSQDGADFYVYRDDKRKDLLLTRTAPFKVNDFDAEAAGRARKWFTELCSARQQIIWG